MIVLLHAYLALGVFFILGGVIADVARGRGWPKDPWPVILFVLVVAIAIWPWLLWNFKQAPRSGK